MSSSKIILFFTGDEIYSQWYPSRFVIDDIIYTSAEQYMMYQKAVFFHDQNSAKKILAEHNPSKIKKLGRLVKNFDDKRWRHVCKDIVRKGTLEKFQQNKRLRDLLMKTGDAIIAEASPYDQRWGIGLDKHDPAALKPKMWKGTNWLGEAIMSVRTELRDADLAKEYEKPRD